MNQPPDNTTSPRCIGCGYGLTGLANHALCPECSLPVWRSQMGAQLRYAAPTYRNSLTLGIALILLSTLLQMITYGGILGMIIYYEEVRKSVPPGVATPWFFPMALLIPNLIGFWGYWLYTMAEPSTSDREGRVTWRKIIRTAVIVQGIGILIGVLLASLGYAANFTSNMPPARLTGAILQLSANGVVFIAWMAQLLAAVLYSRRITIRLRAEGLEAKHRFLKSPITRWILVGVGFLFTGPLVILAVYCRMLWNVRRGIAGIPEPAGQLS